MLLSINLSYEERGVLTSWVILLDYGLNVWKWQMANGMLEDDHQGHK